MSFRKKIIYKFELCTLIAFASLVFDNVCFAIEIVSPHVFTNGDYVALSQVNENFDRLYKSVNEWLPLFGQEKISQAHELVAGQPANAEHLNANFDQLLLSFNWLLIEQQQQKIEILNQLYNGQSANATQMNENFASLSAAANSVYTKYLNKSFDEQFEKTNSLLAFLSEDTISKNYTFSSNQSVEAGHLNSNFDQLFAAYNLLLTVLHQPEITKPFAFSSGQTVEVTQLKQNFQTLSSTANFLDNEISGFRPLTDTGQTTCYDGLGNVITCPLPGEPLAQDGSYNTINQLDYTDNGDGTITDNVTGLVWQKTNNEHMTWHDANSYCSANIAQLTGSGWRLPTINELLSLVDFGSCDPSIHPFFNGRNTNYWTSIAEVPSTGRTWTIRFLEGHPSVYYRTDSSVTFRCVREGP